MERRRGEGDRDAVRAAEQVLRVAGGVGRAPARGDHQIAHVPAAEERTEPLRLCGLHVEQAREGIGLLPELELEPAHVTASATASKLTRLPPCVAMYAGPSGRQTGTPISTTTVGESCSVSSRIQA